ncbi:MAG: family 78 glycoside hydrolase catalytic domain [Bacteroidales bacterium]|nr:family 78 glycoside hydrolase catalytic domain [Candidatus Cacconaster caballi]
MKAFHMLAATLAAVFAAASCGAPASNEAGVRTGALEDSAWDSSVWISAADAPVHNQTVHDDDLTSRSADGASWFVSTVRNDRKVVSAKWMTTGLGVYDIFINGVRIGKEVLKPGFTHYGKTKYSFTYDITDNFLTSEGAENVLSAQVTPGWWADKILTPAGHLGMVGRKCAFRAVLELTYSDGSRQLFGTDTDHWKAGIAGPVLHASIFDGEEYDANKPLGFECADGFSVAEINTEFQGSIFPSDGAEIYLREDLALKPVRAYVWKDIEGATAEQYGKVVILKEFKDGEEIVVRDGETLVVDFGQNCAGVPAFEFKADKGTLLTCLPAELLNDGNGALNRGMDGPEGSCHRTNLRIHNLGLKIQYTFAGGSDFAGYMPRYTFFGYRFISVTATGTVTIRSLKSIPVSSIAEGLETGTVTTGNELVNKLISNTVWGQRSNYLSIPTDCPQRDERLGWTADTQVFSETGTYFANTLKFFHKWMRDMRDTQTPTGAYPSVAPMAMYGSEPEAMMRVGWSDAGIIVPWTIWKQYADNGIIEENWESMERFIDHVNETKYDHNALKEENGNYQWADWLSYEPLESCGRLGWENGRLKPETVDYWCFLNASYWAMDAGMMRDMAAATGRDSSKYSAMQESAKDYLRTTFLNPDGTFRNSILNTMQTPALFALKNGLVEGEAKENMVARLRKNFADHEGCLQTGFLGTSILMDVLTDNGMVDLAYDLLFQRRNPSWLYSVDNGATTIWERWNSYTIESGMGPKGMNSFNHYAYGCVCAWIWKTAAGIESDPAAPGFKHIIMKPVPDRRLGSIEAEYNSAAGLIRSAWRYEGDRWIWNFTIPEGSTAGVTLPGEDKTEEYASGSYTVEI